MREPPTWSDIFHQVMNLIKAFNDNTKIIRIPGLISYIDESMSPWTI